MLSVVSQKIIEMPVGSEYENVNTHDITESISIGLGTANNHSLATTGIALGPRIFGSNDTTEKMSLDGAVLIGSDIYQAANGNHSAEGSVVIGESAGGVVPGARNVIIGASAASELTSGTDNVVLGYSAGDESQVGFSSVIVGASAARSHRLNDANHTVSTGCVIVGKDCGRSNTSSDVARTIGTNTILMNCGAFATSDQDPPADSICIGRDTLSKLVSSTTGQICLGNEAVHNTMLLNTNQSITLRCDSLDNIAMTGTSTTIRNSGTADSHAISLLCGSAARVLFTRVAFRVEGVPITHNGYVTDFNGKSIRGVGSSYWVSGASNIATPTEKRRLVVLPNQAVAADDSGTRGTNAFDDASGDDSLMPSERSAAAAQLIAGTRVATASELYVFFQRPPDGWKCTGARLELLNKVTNAAVSRQIEIFSRSFLTTIDSDPTNSDYLTIHVNQSLDRQTGTDVSFSTAWTPSTTDYLVAHIANGSSNNVFMGGYLQIERV